MTTVLGIAGSTRRHSFNHALLRAAAAAAPPGINIELASIGGIPLYNADHEKEHGLPEPVVQLKERVAAADALLLATPEYNNSIPGVFKNTLDWLTRPPKDISKLFHDKPVALMGASPGRGGTRMAQLAWLQILRTLSTRPWFGKQLYVAHAGSVFDESGELIDDGVRQQLADFLAGFAAFVAS